MDFQKTTCFDTFLKSNSIAHKAFVSLGNNDDGLKEEIIDGLTKFALDLYQPKRPSITLVFIFWNFNTILKSSLVRLLLFVSRYIKVILYAALGKSHCFQLHRI